MATTNQIATDAHDAIPLRPGVEHRDIATQTPDIEAAQASAITANAAPRSVKSAKTSSESSAVPSLREGLFDIINTIGATILLPAGIGLYSIFSVVYAAMSVDKAQMANQLALLSMCHGNQSIEFCPKLLEQTDIYLPKIANALYYLKSAKGKYQPIASEAPKSAAHSTSTVFLQLAIPQWIVLAVVVGSTAIITILFMGYGVYTGFLKFRDLKRRRRQSRTQSQVMILREGNRTPLSQSLSLNIHSPVNQPGGGMSSPRRNKVHVVACESGGGVQVQF